MTAPAITFLVGSDEVARAWGWKTTWVVGQDGMFCRVSDTNHQAYEYLMYVGQQSPVALTEIERGKKSSAKWGMC